MRTAARLNGQWIRGRRTGRVAGELRRDPLDQSSFPHEVLLAADGPGELRHELTEAVERGVRPVTLRQRGEVGQDGQVGLDDGREPGTPNLDGDDIPGSQRGPVHLGNRGSRQRYRVELEEEIIDALSQRLLNRAFRDARRQRWHSVLQKRELGDDLRRQQVRVGAQGLTELHERRSELLERQAEADGPARVWFDGTAKRGKHPPSGGEIRTKVQCLEDVNEPISDQDRGDLGVAAHMRGASDTAPRNSRGWSADWRNPCPRHRLLLLPVSATDAAPAPRPRRAACRLTRGKCDRGRQVATRTVGW